jgi:hypothetical protein
MQVGEHSEHMRVGFLSYEVAKNAREQARPEFRLSEAKSTKKEKIAKKSVANISFKKYFLIFRHIQTTIKSIFESEKKNFLSVKKNFLSVKF